MLVMGKQLSTMHLSYSSAYDLALVPQKVINMWNIFRGANDQTWIYKKPARYWITNPNDQTKHSGIDMQRDTY